MVLFSVFKSSLLLLSFPFFVYLSGFILSFYFKDEFLFLLLNPYLSYFSASTFLITDLSSLLSLYTSIALLFSTFSFVFSLIATFCVFLLSIVCIKFFLEVLFYFFVILFLFFFYFFSIFSNCFTVIELLFYFVPVNDKVLKYYFNITPLSWLSFVFLVALVFFFLFIAFALLLGVSLVSHMPLSVLFFGRIAMIFVIFLLLFLFLPPDPLLHIFVILVSLLFFELSAFLVSVKQSYSI